MNHLDWDRDREHREIYSKSSWDAYVAAHTDWGRFVQQLRHYAERMCHPASADDLRKLSDLLDSANFARFSKEHARSLNAELSVHFGDMCLGGEIEAARLFVSAGSAVTDLATYYGNDNAEAPIAVQPLFQAVAGGSVDTARWLLKLGADVNAQASDGTTPFLVACQEGDLQVVQLLCEHGGNMIASDQDGMTPALIAAASGHVDVIRFLHENGVDLHSHLVTSMLMRVALT